MKTKAISLWALILLIQGFQPLAAAGESAGVDPLPNALAPASSFSGHFTLTVTGDGELIPSPGPVFTVGDEEGVILPYLLDHPKRIAYPRWAIRQGWEGNLILAVEILTDGSVGRLQVMKSTGYKLLDKTASKAIQHWKFHPATKDGKPVLTCIQIPVDFKLEEK